MAVEAQLALSGGTEMSAVDICDLTRTAAVKSLGEPNDQSPPDRSLRGERLVLAEWARDFLREHGPTWCKAVADGGLGLNPNRLSYSGYFEEAPMARVAARLATAPRPRLSSLLASRASASASRPLAAVTDMSRAFHEEHLELLPEEVSEVCRFVDAPDEDEM